MVGVRRWVWEGGCEMGVGVGRVCGCGEVGVGRWVLGGGCGCGEISEEVCVGLGR